jgi:hypothetical protein
MLMRLLAASGGSFAHLSKNGELFGKKRLVRNRIRKEGITESEPSE